VREKVGPAVQSAVQSQMSAIEVTETTSSMDVFDIFETGTKFQGMARESVEKNSKDTHYFGGQHMLLFCLFAGFPSWRISEKSASMQPHVPSSMHRWLAYRPRILPSMQKRLLNISLVS